MNAACSPTGARIIRTYISRLRFAIIERSDRSPRAVKLDAVCAA